MSGDAHVWAKAQDCPTARAKAVLASLGTYADADGRAWCYVSILVIETSLGNERAVQRGINDLKKVGLLEDTGDWHVDRGKRLPIYRLPLERGPANTRERLKLERAKSGVTLVSPQDGAAEVWGDTGDTPRGDTGDALGVTLVSPKETNGIQSNPQSACVGARGARSGVDGLGEAASTPLDRGAFETVATAWKLAAPERFSRPKAWAAWLEALAIAGPDVLERAALRYLAEAGEVKRKRCKGLHLWLAEQLFENWLGEASVATAGGRGWAGPPEVRAKLVGWKDEAFAASYLDPARWDDAARRIHPKTSFGRDALTNAVRAGVLAGLNVTIGEIERVGG